MQKSFWWWQCSGKYILSLFPHLLTPFPPFSPSLISLVVSVDVKHHVYLLSTQAALHWRGPHLLITLLFWHWLTVSSVFADRSERLDELFISNPLPPFSPSLISLMVSVDVKQHWKKKLNQLNQKLNRLNPFIPTVPYSGRITGFVSLFQRSVILAPCWHGPLKRDFLYSKKRWPSISRCCFLEVTVWKNKKAFCIKVFSLKRYQGIYGF